MSLRIHLMTNTTVITLVIIPRFNVRKIIFFLRQVSGVSSDEHLMTNVIFFVMNMFSMHPRVFLCQNSATLCGNFDV